MGQLERFHRLETTQPDGPPLEQRQRAGQEEHAAGDGGCQPQCQRRQAGDPAVDLRQVHQLKGVNP